MLMQKNMKKNFALLKKDAIFANVILKTIFLP